MNNGENAVISITNHQVDGDMSDTLNTKTDCRFYKNNGKYYAIYKESPEVSVMITVRGNSVTVKRSGEMSSVMVCEEGQENTFMYATPYGRLHMKVKTEKVDAELDENGGSIRLVYRLDVNGGYIRNDMLIKVEVRQAHRERRNS